MPLKTTLAILLVGPTGSGKTPLGDLLEQQGIYGRKCFHFDFGAQLRMIANSDYRIRYLTNEDLQVIRTSLTTGKLLENCHFPIAEKILNAYIVKRQIGPNDLLILNGLPRHTGQADALEKTIKIGLILYLLCSPEVIRERIKRNTGGDRLGRTDDSLEAIHQKLHIFTERTAPVIAYYQEKNVALKKIKISTDTTPEEILSQCPARAPNFARTT